MSYCNAYRHQLGKVDLFVSELITNKSQLKGLPHPYKSFQWLLLTSSSFGNDNWFLTLNLYSKLENKFLGGTNLACVYIWKLIWFHFEQNTVLNFMVYLFCSYIIKIQTLLTFFTSENNLCKPRVPNSLLFITFSLGFSIKWILEPNDHLLVETITIHNSSKCVIIVKLHSAERKNNLNYLNVEP